MSDRLRDALANADVIYAEDTRRTAILLSSIGVSKPLRSLFVGNEGVRTSELIESLAEGQTVALVTDAGMPTISDPGVAAVREARAAGIPVTVIPGPSAVTTAIAASGFSGDRFVFEGFLPRKGRARAQALRAIGEEMRPVVLFASPNRLPQDVRDLATACGGQREVAVTRELTKLHEEVWVGSLTEAVARWPEPVKGEVTLVLGPGEPEAPAFGDAVARARELVTEGVSVREASRRVSGETGVSRRAIYESLIAYDESS